MCHQSAAKTYFTLFFCPDAGNRCPPELNFLDLNPPVVIAEYGKTIDVNCTDTQYGRGEMTLVLGNYSAQSDIFDSFVSITTSLTDWNAKGECKIKLNETTECSEEIEIIVYSKYNFKLLRSKALYELCKK